LDTQGANWSGNKKPRRKRRHKYLLEKNTKRRADGNLETTSGQQDSSAGKGKTNKGSPGGGQKIKHQAKRPQDPDAQVEKGVGQLRAQARESRLKQFLQLRQLTKEYDGRHKHDSKEKTQNRKEETNKKRDEFERRIYERSTILNMESIKIHNSKLIKICINLQ